MTTSTTLPTPPISRTWRASSGVIAAVAILACVVGGIAAISQTDFSSYFTPQPAAVEAPPQRFPVSALGHLEPRGEIIQLAAPTVLEGARVEKMLVHCGAQVKHGDLVAVLDSYDRRKVAVEESEANIAVAQTKLQQVLAGAKPADIAAQEALVARANATLLNAVQEFERGTALRSGSAISAEELEKRRLQKEMSEQNFQQAKHLLESVKEVRDVDVQVAKAQIRAAEAAKAKALADLTLAEVRAPITGQVLKVYALAGEKVGDKGVLDIGDTSCMVAVAEVYEADLHRVTLGDNAEVRVAEIAQLLPGKVVEIGQMVGRKNVLNNDPVADTDARVVEVRIELTLEPSKLVSGLSNARVEAIIHVQDEGEARASTQASGTPLVPARQR